MNYVFKILVFIGLSSLCANDTTVSILSGGIVTEEQEPDIEMASEKLIISEKEIKVLYSFFNHGATKKIKIGFPLPPSPYDIEDIYPYTEWDEFEIALRLLYGDTDSATYRLGERFKHSKIIDFSVLVDNKNVHVERYTRALKPTGQDITDLLKENDIPLSSAYLRGSCEEPPMNKFPGMQGKLEKLGLLNDKKIPSWQLHTTYVWESQFDAQKETHVEHVYTPHVGSCFVGAKDFDDIQNFKAANGVQYLITKHLKPHFSESPDKGINLGECTFDKEHFDAFMASWKKETSQGKQDKWRRLHAINYILKTGANWRGPIGKFQLEIHPEHPGDLIIIMGKYPMKRLGNGTCVVELEKFTPAENLCVWFVKEPSALRKNISVFDRLPQWLKSLFVRSH